MVNTPFVEDKGYDREEVTEDDVEND